jgi:signal transduction histidine kinase
MLVDCAGLLEGAATSKNIIIRVLVSHDCRVTGDRKMLETVIRNLASNAIKFSYPNSEIRLRCAINSEVMAVSVEDDGAGMTEETLASLFNQEPSKPDKGTHGETGTGLGLILCRDFLLKHNSELKIQSKPGKGSIFSFSLKVTPE